MRPAEFTSESITKAGQELQAVGRNITGFALRQKVADLMQALSGRLPDRKDA